MARGSSGHRRPFASSQKRGVLKADTAEGHYTGMQELAAKKADSQRKADIADMDERRTTRIFKSLSAAAPAAGQLTSR